MSKTIKITGLRWSETCIGCHKDQEFTPSETFDTQCDAAAGGDIQTQVDSELESKGWANGYCATCVARGFGKGD